MYLSFLSTCRTTSLIPARRKITTQINSKQISTQTTTTSQKIYIPICAMSLRAQKEGGIAHAGQPIAITPKQSYKTRASKIPQPLQFPLVVLLSLTTSSLLSSLLVPFLGNESMRRVAKTPNGLELSVLLGWRM